MGVLRYCDWCRDEISGYTEVEYHKKWDGGFATIDKICSNCQTNHVAFIKSMTQKNRKVYVGYR